MGGKTDVVKGRIKEATGALTNNDKLRREGRIDQALGHVKQTVQKAAASLRMTNKKAVGRANRGVRKS